MKIDLLGGTSTSRYISSNPQQTINWYPVGGQGDKSQISLHPTPGLQLYTTLPGRYGRGLFTVRTVNNTKLFAVVDKYIYEVNTNGTYTLKATLSDLEQSSVRVGLQCNNHEELGIFSRSASYVYNLSTGTTTRITDVEFPDNVAYSTYLDQYGIVVSNGFVFESETTSFLNWNSLQTYQPNFKSAPVIAVGAVKEQIFNFTTECIETYVNDGTSPYSRLPRSTVSVGILSAYTLATWQEGFVFLGKAAEGETNVFFFDGYNPPSPLADANIAWTLNQASSLTDAYGFIQQNKTGSYWYFLTIPSLDKTFVYDFGTKMWHNRSSRSPCVNSDGTYTMGIFRAGFHANFNGKNFYLDTYSGKIFTEDYVTNAEDGNTLRQSRVTQVISNEDKFLSFYSMKIDASVGYTNTNNSVTMLVYSSNDGGITYGAPKAVSLGGQGQYLWQAKIHKLGSSRRRVYKFTVEDTTPIMIQAIYVEAQGDQT